MKYLILSFLLLGIWEAKAAERICGKVVGAGEPVTASISELGEPAVTKTLDNKIFLGSEACFEDGESVATPSSMCRIMPSETGETITDFLLVLLAGGKFYHITVPAGSRYEVTCDWLFEGKIAVN